MITFEKEFERYRNNQQGPPPNRPTSALHSEFWKYTNLPWKRVVLDEVQKVNKHESVRHQAIKSLHARAFVGLSGTLPHNKWHNIDGYLDFLRNHPWDTHQDFMHMMAEPGEGEPSHDLLQRPVRSDHVRPGEQLEAKH